MKKRNKYQSGSMAVKLNKDQMPILIQPRPKAGESPDLGTRIAPIMPKPAKPPVKTNNPEPRPMASAPSAKPKPRPRPKPKPRPRPKPEPRPNLASDVMEESKTRPTVKPPTSNRRAEQRAKAQARMQAARSRIQARRSARSRTRRAEGGMTDFKSIYDMEKKSGK